jgi:methylase of polypeptide subunit release factors
VNIAPQIIPTNWHEREALREKGQFWTPDWVADAMVEYVSQETDMVFDPATGGGAFLAALRRTHPEIRFHGVDVDKEVLHDVIYFGKNTFAEHRDFIKNPPNQRFKAIIANPPYIRHHRIDEQTKSLLKQMTARITGFTIDGRAGLHVYFLIQALHLLEAEGRLAFLVPADICEGKFAPKLWKWVADNFCIECVATFSEEAAPFPTIDTNALIFFIKNEKPRSHVAWIKIQERGNELFNLVKNQFDNQFAKSSLFEKRTLAEALKTGFSRSQNHTPTHRYHLSDFATVMRGIATGANEFFFLTEAQIAQSGLPLEFFKRAIGRTRDVEGDILTGCDMVELDRKGRPTHLLSIEKSFDSLPIVLRDYLKKGEESGLPERALIRQRNPWYKQEKRAVPELLFAYLGRRSTRFILNEAEVVPLHCLHCVYTHSKNPEQVNALWQALNHPDTLSNLHFVSKSYGSGALKAEPQNLAKLPIPDHIVEKFGLLPRYKPTDEQLLLFNETKIKSHFSPLSLSHF